MQIRRGSLVVFEGVDRAGKSTQVARMKALLDPATVSFAHMPTGFSVFSRAMRGLLEEPESRPTSGLAQQLAHLACHAESVPALRQRLTSGAVVLDRWWWSTLAYGWGGGPVADSGVSLETFERLIGSVWRGVEAQVVFVFDHPHGEDDRNNAGVAAGYAALSERYDEIAVPVPVGSVGAVTDVIVTELDRRHLLVADEA